MSSQSQGHHMLKKRGKLTQLFLLQEVCSCHNQPILVITVLIYALGGGIHKTQPLQKGTTLDMLQCCLNFNTGICRGHLDYSRDLVVLIFQMMRSRLREGMCLSSRYSISDLRPHLLSLSLFFNILYSHTFATLRLYGHPSR